MFPIFSGIPNGFFEFRILGVDEIDPTQFSCVFKVVLFLRPLLLFLQLGMAVFPIDFQSSGHR